MKTLMNESDHYDALVIGAGPAGEVCAGELADGGMRVAVAERELVAGECAYWACMPSKTLLRPGEIVAQARHAPGAKQALDGEIDQAAALGWRDFMVSGWDDADKVDWLTEKGIDLLRGDARIAAPGRVDVGKHRIGAGRIVLATGSEPVKPPISGLEVLEGVWTNREAMELDRVPERVLILGGGPVGVETGQALSRLGASVAIAESAPRLIAKEPSAAGEALADAFEREGIELRLGAEASSAARHGEGYVLAFADGSSLVGEKLIVATGRRPRLTGLGLEAIGLSSDGPIEVDERLRTAAEGVWAVGDITDVMPFTHVGKYQAKIAAADILGRSAKADYRAIPRTIFTDPQVAAVGETEAERSGSVQLAELARASTWSRDYEEQPGFLTLYSDGEALTGALAVGPEATEWIGQATLAIKAAVPLAVLRDTIQPFPSFSEAFGPALARLG